MADLDAALAQQIFHLAKRQRGTNVQHRCQEDYLAARFEVAKWIRFRHPWMLRNHPARLKPVSSDNPDNIALRSNRAHWVIRCFAALPETLKVGSADQAVFCLSAT